MYGSKMLKNNGVFISWEAFVKALQIRFGSLAYDDPMKALTRLKQLITILAYKAQFERISNRLRSLSKKNKLGCFLSGLKDKIG